MASGTRAERRREERARRKAAKKGGQEFDASDQTVRLVNPETERFEQYIFANALECNRMVEQNTRKGQSVLICGAGPSLRAHAADLVDEVDEVWGVNSAAIWLHDSGHRVTHAFTVDQTAMMVKEWIAAPPLEYMIASSVHPHLTEYLKMRGYEPVFFHNFVAIRGKPPVRFEDSIGVTRTASFEEWMYRTLYPEVSVMAGSGLNSTTRAVDVARFMGFDRIILAGADCAMESTERMPLHLTEGSPEHIRWLERHTTFHANGDHAVANGQSPVTLHGEIDGRYWLTKPDLMITAVQIGTWLRDGTIPGLECVGDVLPNVLATKDDEFLARLPKITNEEGVDIGLPV